MCMCVNSGDYVCMMDMSFMCPECMSAISHVRQLVTFLMRTWLGVGVVAQWGMGASGLLHRVSQ